MPKVHVGILEPSSLWRNLLKASERAYRFQAQSAVSAISTRGLPQLMFQVCMLHMFSPMTATPRGFPFTHAAADQLEGWPVTSANIPATVPATSDSAKVVRLTANDLSHSRSARSHRLPITSTMICAWTGACSFVACGSASIMTICAKNESPSTTVHAGI
jgi:hypothetical protein